MKELRELFHELSDLPFWVWIAFVLLILVGAAENFGLWPSGQVLCPWWVNGLHC